MRQRPLNTLRASVLAIALLACALPACAHHPADSATRARFAGQQLELRDQDGQCTLIKPDQSDLKLLLKWPCQFHRDPNGRLRTKRVGSTPVLLIESSEKMPAPSQDCHTEIQALRAIEGGLEPSPAVSQVASCPPFQWDEKVFIGLFEPQA